MSDLVQVVFGEAQNIVNEISSSAKKVEDQVGRVRSGLGVTITPGVWEGTGAENFAQYVLTQYIPEAMQLIASIFGMSTGMLNGLDIFQKADDQGFGQIQDLIGGFNFF